MVEERSGLERGGNVEPKLRPAGFDCGEIGALLTDENPIWIGPYVERQDWCVVKFLSGCSRPIERHTSDSHHLLDVVECSFVFALLAEVGGQVFVHRFEQGVCDARFGETAIDGDVGVATELGVPGRFRSSAHFLCFLKAQYE